MVEVAEAMGANVLILGNIASLRADLFAMNLRFFSARTNELRQVNFNVANLKETRWKQLNESLMAELDRFISTEVDRIFNVATNFYAGAKYADAESQLQTAIGLDPENVDAYYYLGATYYKTDRYALAETSFNQALELDPTHYQTLVMMNEMYEKTGENLKRIGVMERIADINDDVELWLAIGNLYAEAGEMVKSETAFRNALALDESSTTVQTRLAFLLFDRNALPRLFHIWKALTTTSRERPPSRRLAVSYQRSGRMAEAIARY
jgi:tetratricopeptide (TPR) repeat protein